MYQAVMKFNFMNGRVPMAYGYQTLAMIIFAVRQMLHLMAQQENAYTGLRQLGHNPAYPLSCCAIKCSICLTVYLFHEAFTSTG
jgi:hypothetical protein